MEFASVGVCELVYWSAIKWVRESIYCSFIKAYEGECRGDGTILHLILWNLHANPNN